MVGKLATLCYIRKDGKTLMLHRNKKAEDLHKDMFVAPGGKMEPEDAGKIGNTNTREIFEETGLTVQEQTLKGVLTFYNKDRKFSDHNDAKKWGKRWDVFVYVATAVTGTAKAQGVEGDLVWIADEQITSLHMHEGDRLFTPWIYGEKCFIASFHYLDKDLTSHDVSFFETIETFEQRIKEQYGDIL